MDLAGQLQSDAAHHFVTTSFANLPGMIVREGHGRNVNWTTPDALADMARQSTFLSNQGWAQQDPRFAEILGSL